MRQVQRAPRFVGAYCARSSSFIVFDTFSVSSATRISRRTPIGHTFPLRTVELNVPADPRPPDVGYTYLVPFDMPVRAGFESYEFKECSNNREISEAKKYIFRAIFSIFLHFVHF